MSALPKSILCLCQLSPSEQVVFNSKRTFLASLLQIRSFGRSWEGFLMAILDQAYTGLAGRTMRRECLIQYWCLGRSYWCRLIIWCYSLITQYIGMDQEHNHFIEQQAHSFRPKIRQRSTEMPEYWPGELVPYTSISYCQLIQVVFAVVLISCIGYVIFGLK